MTVLLAAALAVPAAGLALARVAPTAVHARRWVTWACLAAGGLWLVLFADLDASVGRFGASAPVAVATWLLASSVSWPTRRLSAALVVAASAAAVGGASLGAGRGDLADAAGGLALATVLVIVATRLEDDGGAVAAITCALGAAAIAAGLVRLEVSTGGFVAGGGVLTVLGSAAVAVAAATRTRRAASTVVPLGLALGIQAAAPLGDPFAVALGALGVACAARGWLGSSLAAWSLAAAVVGALPAALLLAAAAVVATVWFHPVAAVLALPGAASLTFAVGDDGSLLRVVLGLAAVGTALLLWRSPGDDVLPGRPTVPTLAAAGLGGWLLLAPESWGWVGAAELGDWGTAVAAVVVAGLLAAYALATVSGVHLALPPLDVADPLHGAGDPRGAGVATLVAAGILGVASVALVASVLS